MPEALHAYPNRPETKFLNGGAYDTGPTERCHVIATHVQMIGKEADRWEEEYFLGLGGDMPIDRKRPCVGGDNIRASARPWKPSARPKCPKPPVSIAGSWQRSSAGSKPLRGSRITSLRLR